MPNVISADALLQSDELKPARCPVPELGAGAVLYVSQLSADERDEMEELWQDVRRAEDSAVGFRAFVVAYCACNEHNERYYQAPDAIKQAAGVLGKRHSGAIGRAFNIACERNALTASDVEELEKNSEATPSDGGSGE